EAAETTAESLNHFLDSHLGAFVESFVRSLEPSGVPYLIATAHAILRKVKEPVNQEPEASAP
ncbi:MAG: hypothetical protein V3U77_02400, partial [bacterium]